MSHTNQPEKIPFSTAPFFQEYDFAALDAQQDAALVIERLLAYGNRAEVRWLLKTYGREKVSKWVMHSGVNRLPWRRLHLWCFVFDIPLPEKPKCIWPY